MQTESVLEAQARQGQVVAQTKTQQAQLYCNRNQLRAAMISYKRKAEHCFLSSSCNKPMEHMISFSFRQLECYPLQRVAYD